MTSEPTTITTNLDPLQIPAQEIAPVFSNRFFVTVHQTTTRIAFAANVGGEGGVYHTVVVLPTADAAELAGLLGAVIATAAVPTE